MKGDDPSPTDYGAVEHTGGTGDLPLCTAKFNLNLTFVNKPWRLGLVVGVDQRSCSTPSPVSTGSAGLVTSKSNALQLLVTFTKK